MYIESTDLNKENGEMWHKVVGAPIFVMAGRILNEHMFVKVRWVLDDNTRI